MTGEIARIGRPRLPKSLVELYYDIEGEPNLDIDYLHGLLVVAQDEEPTYTSRGQE